MSNRNRKQRLSNGKLPKTPGTKTGLELNAPVTSRKFCPSPRPASDAAVSVINCLWRKDGTGSFTGDSGTWETAKFVELYMLADSDEYNKDATGICFIGGVQYDFVVTTRSEDVIPDAIVFDPVTGAELSTATESNTITISGIDTTATLNVTATGLQYSKNSGAYTATAGTVVLGDTIKVRLTSSGSYSDPATGTLTVAGIPSAFSVTTRAADTTPAAFSFTDVTDAEISTLTESDAITVSGIEIAVSFTVTGGEAEKNDSGTWATSGTVVATDTVKLRVTSASEYEAAVSTTLNINGVSDTFTVTTAAYQEPSSGFPFTFPFELG